MAGLQRVFAEVFGSLVGSIARLVGDLTEAEDIVQDVFADLWHRPHIYDPTRGSLVNLLHIRCRGVAIDRLRSRTRRRRREAFVAVGETAVDEDPDPWHDDKIALRRAVDALSSHQRRLVELTYVDGLSYADAAVVLGIPIGTAKSQMRRVLQTLRAELQPMAAQATSGGGLVRNRFVTTSAIALFEHPSPARPQQRQQI